MAFPRIGLGAQFASTFDRAVSSRSGIYPNVPRTQTLLMTADFSGQHSGQHFDTYAFLFLDLDRNQSWFSAQREFRRSVLRAPRRMAFKSMNDNKRRRALVPFLRLANEMEGCLFLFAISKTGGSMFSPRQQGDASSDILASWKPRVQERLLRILHLSGFLTAGLSVAGQDLLWIIDKDEIASNVDQLTQLTKVFGQISSHYLEHDLRHIRCGTTGSDDGSLALEDLAAIPNLAAGALLRGRHCDGRSGALAEKRDYQSNTAPSLA